MKRSENVGLVVMGAAAFVATFAGGLTYMAWQQPGHAQAQTAAATGQRCTTRSDGTQDCRSQRTGFSYFLFGTWGNSNNQPAKPGAAFASNARSAAMPVSSGGIERAGFGSTARTASIRVSAGG